MDEKGVNYPAERINAWFESADIVHISNEVSFKENCDLSDRGRFCSKPEYFQLLETIHAKIIELTGNHLLDFGTEPFLNTLALYKQNNMQYYGGGENIYSARKPALIMDHGNKLAFVGCNSVGPDADLASSITSGANPCNREWLKSEISNLRMRDTR